ncbi:GNAT family N-acetyltransferase [Exiguobacterium aurantiacum]|uniref:GNAT family N-acetyltransferase n=1 Tax=Exiguobacterium aurantiacum TaxID=33987 RepID=A0ABY5FQC3_9BACL|nr:GNAT family N-acetyltransferase [Exiguobacterium aurantiacum]UTT43397.1 GNAT family N-acetyltransferase [Exiguobacterium aurantiacum]
MTPYSIRHIFDLNHVDLTDSLVASRQEGFRMLDRLVDDFRDGRNRFNQPGECLLGVFDASGNLLGIGGLNQDPYSLGFPVGRLRRFYILPDYRRQGIGRRLANALLLEAKRTFLTVILRTYTTQGAQFYESLGFIPYNTSTSSHVIRFNETSSDSS